MPYHTPMEVCIYGGIPLMGNKEWEGNYIEGAGKDDRDRQDNIKQHREQ